MFVCRFQLNNISMVILYVYACLGIVCKYIITPYCFLNSNDIMYYFKCPELFNFENVITKSDVTARKFHLFCFTISLKS